MLRIVPGRISGVRADADKPTIGWLRTALPTSAGALLNQRDLDQGLENLRRLQSQADATFDIAPGSHPGDSELVLPPGTGKRWHALFGIDNGGLNSTGKTSLSGSFTYDSPFHLYDQLQIAGSTNANFGAHGQGNQSALANYSVPIGYVLFAAGASRSRYKQSVPGLVPARHDRHTVRIRRMGCGQGERSRGRISDRANASGCGNARGAGRARSEHGCCADRIDGRCLTGGCA